MGRHIHKVSTKGMNEQAWLNFRTRGIGGSEIATLLGLSSYTTPLELYLEKIGEYTRFQEINRFIGFGELHEPEIANLYQYWDGNVDQLFRNLKANKIINRVRSVHAYILNDKHPELFSSIDRMILAKSGRSTGVLECKNIGSNRLTPYSDDIPYEHAAQLISYLLTTEYEFGELALEIDGNNYQVYEFSKNDSLVTEFMEQIKRVSVPFWERVNQARKIKKEYGITSYYDMHPDLIEDPKIQEGVAMLQLIEPSPEPDELLEDFLKKLFKPEPVTIEGDNELWELAVKHQECKEQEKTRKAEFDEMVKQGSSTYGILIKTKMKNVEKIDFGSNGYITWKPDKNGNRRFRVNLN